MNGGIFYAEEREEAVVDLGMKIKEGIYGYCRFLWVGWGVEVWGNWCKRFYKLCSMY